VIATRPFANVSVYRIRLESTMSVGARRALKRQIFEAVRTGVSRVLVDCSPWSQFDLMAVSALLNCAAVCREQGVEFELENVADDMKMRIAGLRVQSWGELATVPAT
jgi:anti-anti-sigma regulatory factor